MFSALESFARPEWDRGHFASPSRDASSYLAWSKLEFGLPKVATLRLHQADDVMALMGLWRPR